MTFISSTVAPTRKSVARRPRLASMIAVWRQRQQLRRLDDRALRDIGLRRVEAEAEAARPIWDVPAYWKG